VATALGGLTQLSTDPSQPPLYPYKPEYSNNIEIGSKNSFWNNRIRLNVAAFLTYVTNAQVPTLILPDAITITRMQAG
jgi:iron complex outermembrane receptor protein